MGFLLRLLKNPNSENLNPKFTLRKPPKEGRQWRHSTGQVRIFKGTKFKTV
jgi:hypothetical protein